MDYLKLKELYHSSFAEEEKARRKAALKKINCDFLDDLPVQVRGIMDELRWEYKDQPWFEEAWEKYRKHVLDAGLGGKIKMPGFVFNEYIDRYVDEKEKKIKKEQKEFMHMDTSDIKELMHMDTCDIDELYHHGVKGQKWGIRRYQNDDGTLTPEGKARYGVDAKGKMSKEGAALYKQDRKSALKQAKADLKDKKLGVAQYWGGSEAQNTARFEMAKQYVRDNYGKQTLKDFMRDEAKKELAVGGAALLATAGLGAIAIHKTLKKNPI